MAKKRIVPFCKKVFTFLAMTTSEPEKEPENETETQRRIRKMMEKETKAKESFRSNKRGGRGR